MLTSPKIGRLGNSAGMRLDPMLLEFLDVTVGGKIDVMQDEKSRALVIKKHMITPENLADLLDGWDGDFEEHSVT
ncbi:MAG: AbrB/MazE/SpoVT family DNA-binding domain-containing protein [Pseudolactococcus laudensis]|uniref:Uncharacterized protein n=1 Tax=Pseudolactococcus laudensis TaxID=1494461 RepID=A0A7V8MZS6_9LACT|nr:hypothetical protein [Lactococcus laudensis]MBA0015996.1 hypothetical protein [Lactococcus laudensis]MBW9281757.1 hypothetical protein [Lactococcus laudensis]